MGVWVGVWGYGCVCGWVVGGVCLCPGRALCAVQVRVIVYIHWLSFLSLLSLDDLSLMREEFMRHIIYLLNIYLYVRDIFIKFPRGAFEILDLFLTNFGPFEKKLDLSVCRTVQRSRYLN